MNTAELATLPAELAAMRAELGALMQRLNEVFAERPKLSQAATKAQAARAEASALGYHTVATFSACVGRSGHFISDRCAARVIRTLPGGKPYRIPLTEEDEWNKAND